jgi:hypothetical protein
LKEYFYWAGRTCQWPISVLTTWDDHPVPHATLFPVATLTAWRAARRWWPPVVIAPRGLAPLSMHPDVTTGGHHPFCSPSHCSTATSHCFALHRPPLHPPSPGTDKQPPSCPTGPKEAPRYHAPHASKTCMRRQLVKPGNGSSPAVVFLREHSTSGSLLRLFPDPTMSSAPPKSSSPTTSLAPSTTPLSPHRCLLPVDTRAP